jgi:hypothetical protein
MAGIDGFAAYYLAGTGDTSLVTAAVFADRVGGEESARAAGKGLREVGLADAVPNPPTIMQGGVAIHAQALT